MKELSIRETNNLPLLTIVWYNGPREILEILIASVMQNKRILAAYCLEPVERIQDFWRVLTPDSVSGMTVVMAQVLVMPRCIDIDSWKVNPTPVGNLACDGRRNIAMTRAFEMLSWHIAEEVLNSSADGSHWDKMKEEIETKRIKGKVREVYGSVEDVYPSDWFGKTKHIVEWDDEARTRLRTDMWLFREHVAESRALSMKAISKVELKPFFESVWDLIGNAEGSSVTKDNDPAVETEVTADMWKKT